MRSSKSIVESKVISWIDGIEDRPDGLFSVGPYERPGSFKNPGPNDNPGGIPSPTEVYGSNGDDDIDHEGVNVGQEIYSFAGDDTVRAGSGDDTIFSGLGDDTIMAWAGDDLAVGGEGNDFIDGNAGNDTIHAGEGEDQIFGGADDDLIFLVDDGDEDIIYFNQSHGNDVIDNFEHGIDKVGLGGFGFTSFDDIDDMLVYIGDQAMLDLGGGDSIIFTQLEGPLTADDFIFG